MSRVGRGRRTRVYDCNYDAGESYYRPVLDRLDGKLPAAKEPDRERVRSDVESRIRSALDDIESPADDLFDSRGARAPRGRPISTQFDDDEFNDEVSASLKRLRAGKKSSRFSEDVDFENSLNNLESRIKISDKILESVGIGSESSSARRALLENEQRTEKRIARRQRDDEGSLTKWSALKGAEEEESAAVQRARASRARLTDLEDEMTEMNERSAMREKRAARLRALVADSDADLVDSSVTMRSRLHTEKKQVTF